MVRGEMIRKEGTFAAESAVPSNGWKDSLLSVFLVTQQFFGDDMVFDKFGKFGVKDRKDR